PRPRSGCRGRPASRGIIERMAQRRPLARLWRRLRRPSFGRLVGASLAVHLAAIAVALWIAVTGPPPLPPSTAPLVVELPPAAPGVPLSRPEPSGPPGGGASANPRPPAPSTPAPRTASPAPAARSPVPPTPPAVASRAPEPLP